MELAKLIQDIEKSLYMEGVEKNEFIGHILERHIKQYIVKNQYNISIEVVNTYINEENKRISNMLISELRKKQLKYRLELEIVMFQKWINNKAFTL